MCLICVEFSKGSMTYVEAYKALRESAMDPIFTKEHLEDAIDLIDSKELERQQSDRNTSN